MVMENMEVILYILLAIIIILLLLFSVLVIILYQPVKLRLDSFEREYIITFVGGFIRYERKDGEHGIRRKFLHKNGFIPFKSLFMNKKENAGKNNRKNAKKKKTIRAGTEVREKRRDSEINRRIFRLLFNERELLKKILHRLFLAFLDIPRAFHLEYAHGRFYVEDPFFSGIYYALLGPFCRNKFFFAPGFMDDDYINFSMSFVPGKVVFRFVRFFLTLPVLRVIRLGWRIYRIRKS
jgi:hypothetical protein